MKTMSSINKAINNEATCTDEDDDKLFCKEMDAKHNSLAKIQILKVFHDMEWTNSPRDHAYPILFNSYNVVPTAASNDSQFQASRTSTATI